MKDLLKALEEHVNCICRMYDKCVRCPLLEDDKCVGHEMIKDIKRLIKYEKNRVTDDYLESLEEN